MPKILNRPVVKKPLIKKPLVKIPKVAKINWDFSYGNDIEFHVFDIEKQKLVTAIPILNCDKDTPINLGDGILCYADNILLETAFPPYYSKDEMFHRFETVFSKIQERIGPNYLLFAQASHVYDDDELNHPAGFVFNNEGQIINKALEAGCSTNYNAYTVKPNPSVSFNGGLRSAGFHCHVGHEKLTDFNTRINVIKLFDICLGCPSIIFNQDKTEPARRMLYGASSEHRPTDFGLEYRPLSPGILNSRETTELTFDLINYGLEHFKNNTINDVLNMVDPELVQDAIDKCKPDLAEFVLLQTKMPENLIKRIKQNYSKDFYKAWNLK